MHRSSALCWSHARRKFFELAGIAGNARKNKRAHDISPVALEAVKRIDAIFDIEREINGIDANARLAIRQERPRPLVEDLHVWLRDKRAQMSKHNSVAKAIDYLMPPKAERWEAFTAFLDDGRICLTNSEHVNATGPNEHANAGARPARYRIGQKVMALCWIRARRRQGSLHV